jgi:hypothetical protein
MSKGYGKNGGWCIKELVVNKYKVQGNGVVNKCAVIIHKVEKRIQSTGPTILGIK